MNEENSSAVALASVQALEETVAAVDDLVVSAEKFRVMKGLHEKKYHRRLAAGLLPERIKIGGRYFFRREDAESWRDPIAERRAAKAAHVAAAPQNQE